ncbi:hypothetical protein TK90_2854 (plasmid) [Thioalkalivibrio sp. K90mix]|uniref:hypothetical protein n=1 Tax=Thioalkalivibrio sp. (strain K90mix) TaxID=396595 RepID=UPI000195A8C9|nr:hypothetical protein [Thioalkalivibrio sp. K90mix]ADC73338.1 hypothetical protein TK90_2854 [Thioalkalivibrio sp. K90mix]
MFSLIIVLISIGLAAALAVATLYYGGDVFVGESANAESARILNEATQIVGAVNLRSGREGTLITDMNEDLVPRYIQTVPEGWVIDENEGVIYLPGDAVSDAACERMNERQGADHTSFDSVGSEDRLVPSCDDEGMDDYPAICCTNDA